MMQGYVSFLLGWNLLSLMISMDDHLSGKQEVSGLTIRRGMLGIFSKKILPVKMTKNLFATKH